MQISNRRSVMTLYSSPNDLSCHRVRMVLAEKGISYEIVTVEDIENPPEDLIEYNPYNTVPTLVDRESVLFDTATIIEYLDERFPHPPLMPVDPVGRANLKMLMVRIRNDWDPLLEKLIGKTDKQNQKIRKDLKDRLVSTAPIFSQKEFFMSEEFTLIDCYLTPVLWRLREVHIELPESAQPLTDYAQRMFAREAFIDTIKRTSDKIIYNDDE